MSMRRQAGGEPVRAGRGFHELLRAYRARSGLSQVRLAAAAGIDRSFLSRLENGQRWPSRVVVLRLARPLGLDDADRAALLMAAGYSPLRIPHDLRSLAAELERLVEVVFATLEEASTTKKNDGGGE